MSSLLLTGGRFLDPASQFDATTDILLRAGRVAGVGAEAGRGADAGTERLDVRGLDVRHAVRMDRGVYAGEHPGSHE